MSTEFLKEVLLTVKDLERRLHNMISYGIVSSVDPGTATCVVQSGLLKTKALPWLSGRAGKDKEWFTPDVGEQVVVFSPSGDPANGFVLVGIFCGGFPANSDDPDLHRIDYEGGGYYEHNKTTNKITISAPHELELIAPNINIKGNINHTGQQTSSVDVVAAGVSLKGHSH